MAKRKDFDTKISGALGNMGNTKETVKEIDTVEKEKRMAEYHKKKAVAKKKAQNAMALLEDSSDTKKNKKKERFTIMLYPDMKKRLKRMTADSDKFLSFSDAIAEALEKHLTEKGF